MSREFEAYKKEATALRESIDAKQARIQTALDNCLVRFACDEGDTLICVEDFGNLKLGERQYVNEGIYFIPIEYGVKEWVFYTHIDPGYYFGIHDHNVGELCKVISGILIDKITGDTYSPGETAYWPAKEKHKPGGEVETELLVIFNIEHLKGTDNVTPAL